MENINTSNNKKNKYTPAKFDLVLQAEYEYIIENSKKINESDLLMCNIEVLNEIKVNDVKKRRFKKWYKMSYNQNIIKYLSKVEPIELRKAIVKLSYIPNINVLKSSLMSEVNSDIISTNTIKASNSNTISYCEYGLREYYIKNKDHFKSRVVKGPPEMLRIKAWMIIADIPLNRPSDVYMNILQKELNDKTQNQINKDIMRSLQSYNEDEEQSYNQTFIDSLTRILKSIALLDEDLSYCQGMNFISGFLLVLANGNEIDTFYILIALFSNTFNQKYGIRGFYVDNFPKLSFYLYIFENYFKKKLHCLYRKFEEIEIPKECWIMKWIQTLFVTILPNDSLKRVWDIIFVRGVKCIISIALGILCILEEKLMSVRELTEALEVFRKVLLYGKVDIEKVIKLSESRFHIKKKEMRKYEEEFKKKGNVCEKKIYYDYMNISIRNLKNGCTNNNRRKISDKLNDEEECECDYNCNIIDCERATQNESPINIKKSLIIKNPFHSHEI